MSHPTLAVIFRNPRPQRSPIDNELYLLRRDGSSRHIHYSDKGELNRAEDVGCRKAILPSRWSS
jgi:hypothetical protein